MKKIDVNLNIEVSKDIYDSLDYNDDRSIDVEFRVLSKSDYDSELISEQIKKSDWVIDSDFFSK